MNKLLNPRILQKYRFLSVSLLVHFLLVLLLGGVVLYKESQKSDFFVSNDEGILAADANEQQSEEAVPEFAPEEPAAAESGEASSMSASAITTLASNASFAVSSASNDRVAGNILGDHKFGTLSGKGAGGGAGLGGKGGMTGTLFGAKSDGTGFSGYFYDLRRNPQGGASAATESVAENELGLVFVKVAKQIFDRRGAASSSELAKYFKAPSSLSTFAILLPSLASDSAPKSFEVQAAPGHSMWLVNYKGRIAPENPGRFRFVGGGDEILIVRVNGKLVLDGTWQAIPWGTPTNNPTGWEVKEKFEGPRLSDSWKVGEWFDARGAFDLEVTVGEGWGGKFAAVLTVEESGKEYANKPRPLFKIEGYQSMTPLLEPSIKEYAQFITMEGPTFRLIK